jgi:hypothetical protein
MNISYVMNFCAGAGAGVKVEKCHIPCLHDK